MCKRIDADWMNRYFERLERCVMLETPSHGADAMNRLSDLLREDFLAAGCTVKTHPRVSGNLLECRVGSGKRQILLLGHMDTVFAEGTAASNPYRLENGRLRGPGVLDMKSGVLMILEILRYYADCMPADWSLCALLNADEEVGSGDSESMIRQLAAESEYCICMEPSKPGFCTVARKGLITFRVETTGVAAHSGVNYLLGHSAIQSLCHIVERLYTLRDDEKGISVNIGGISGGTGKSNIVADHAELTGEVRFYEPALSESLLSVIRAIAADTGDPAVESVFTLRSVRPPMQHSAASKALYEIARACATANGLQLEPRTHGGGSDGSFAADMGIPVIDGMGAEGEFSHTTDEYVLAETVQPRLQTCIDLIARLIGAEEK